MTPCFTLLKLGNACPAMMSACWSTPMNCGAKISAVGTATSSQGQDVGQPSTHRMPPRVEKPPGQQEQDDDEPAGEVHREDAHQRQHGRRDAVAMPQRRGDQDKRRDRDAVGRQVGHRGDAELDVGHRRERRRHGGRRGRRPGGAPLAGGGIVVRGPEQTPGEHRGAGRKQPDRRRHRSQRVAGGGRRPGELTEHRGQGVKHRRVDRAVGGSRRCAARPCGSTTPGRCRG